MDYKKKYQNALEWAKSIYPSTFGVDREDLEHFFPELKESEDERIRKELIEFVKSRGGFKQEYITWLEKQKEKKPFDYENVNIRQRDFAPKKGGEHDTEV